MNTEHAILVQRLKEKGLCLNRFLEVKLDKKPREPKGYMDHLRTPEEMEKAGVTNWGIAAIKSDPLTLIDCDEQEIYDVLSKVLPETFEVTSASRKLPHKYYSVIGKHAPNRTFTLGKKDEQGHLLGCGELRADNYYVVAPGSYVDFYNGQRHIQGTYIISKNVPITEIEYNVFMDAIKPWLKEAGKDEPITMKEITEGVGSGYRHFYGIRMACYLKGVQRLDHDTASVALKLWNQKLTPPMGDSDLNHILECAEEYMIGKTPLDSQNNDLAKFATDPLILKQILLDIERTVKFDIPSKTTVLMTGLSAYAKAMNLSFKSESGSGKTYISTEVIDFFPEEDVWLIGGMTPKALIREKGILMNVKGEPITLEYPEKPNRMDYKPNGKFEKEAYETAKKDFDEKEEAFIKELKDSYNLIDLTGKILLFLETPSIETISMLRPILSHDKKEITYKFVDKSKNGPMRTITAKLKGWPATIFLSVDKWHMEEFSTRTFTVSPSIDSEKVYAAQEVIDNKDSQPWEYDHNSEVKTNTKTVIRYIKEILQKDNIEVIIPFPNLRSIFNSKNKAQIRDMRDYDHYKQLVKGFAILHLFQRPIIKIRNKFYLLAAVNDPMQAKEIFDNIAETTKTSTDQRMLDFYNKIITVHPGSTVEELTKEYNDDNKENPLSDASIWKYLKRLTKINYIEQRKGENKEDKRKSSYYPLKKTESDLLSENPLDLRLFLESDFKSWLETDLLQGITFDSKIIKITYRKNEGTILTDCPLSIEDVQKLIFNVIKNSSSKTSVFNPETQPFRESKPKTNGQSESKLDSLNKPQDAVKNDKFLKISKAVGTEGKKRYCSVECANFNKPSCVANDWQSLNEQSEIPLKCSGYANVGVVEEALS